MAITRQAYEWRGIMPNGVVCDKTGHPILGQWSFANPAATSYDECNWIPDLPGGDPIDIIWGGKGNNLNTSASTNHTQLLILDGLACWPRDANVNVYVNDRYFFEAPDYSSISGLSGSMVPFPEPNAENIFTHEAFREGIYPPIIIQPNSTWGIYWSQDNATKWRNPTSDAEIPRAFVRYYLVDGPDLLIAHQLQKLNLPLTLRNFQKYKQDLLRWQTMGDSYVFRLNEGVDR